MVTYGDGSWLTVESSRKKKEHVLSRPERLSEERPEERQGSRGSRSDWLVMAARQQSASQEKNAITRHDDFHTQSRKNWTTMQQQNNCGSKTVFPSKLSLIRCTMAVARFEDVICSFIFMDCAAALIIIDPREVPVDLQVIRNSR